MPRKDISKQTSKKRESTSNKEVYCGINEPKSKQRRGSMRECAERGQIRYFGLKKIDDRAMKTYGLRTEKGKQKHMDDTLKKLGSYRGKRYRLRADLPYEKDRNKKAEMKEEIKKLTVKIAEQTRRYHELKKTMDLKRQSRRKTR